MAGATITIIFAYDLHVKCCLCSYEWVDKNSKSKEKLNCPNCRNLVNYEKLDIQIKTKQQ